MKKVNKRFVSEIDKKLVDFNESQPRSDSQVAEMAKYDHIIELRDNPTPAAEDQGSIWDWSNASG